MYPMSKMWKFPLSEAYVKCFKLIVHSSPNPLLLLEAAAGFLFFHALFKCICNAKDAKNLRLCSMCRGTLKAQREMERDKKMEMEKPRCTKQRDGKA